MLGTPEDKKQSIQIQIEYLNNEIKRLEIGLLSAKGADKKRGESLVAGMKTRVFALETQIKKL